LLFLDQRAAVLGRGDGLPQEVDLVGRAREVMRRSSWEVPDARALGPWRWRVAFPLATARLARTYAEVNLHPLAAERLEDAVTRFPHSPDLFNDYGVSLLRTGKARHAVDAFDQALILDPHRATSAVGRSWAVAGLAGPARAVSWLEPWCERHPSATPAWVALTEHAAAAGDHGRARELAEEVYERNPSEAKALAVILHRIGERDRAREMIEATLRLHPGDAGARALYHQMTGRHYTDQRGVDERAPSDK
jgi:Tfp pilus assembly protein PilF